MIKNTYSDNVLCLNIIVLNCIKRSHFATAFKYGVIPQLEVDGTKLYQLHAILNYLAREFGILLFFIYKIGTSSN